MLASALAWIADKTISCVFFNALRLFPDLLVPHRQPWKIRQQREAQSLQTASTSWKVGCRAARDGPAAEVDQKLVYPAASSVIKADQHEALRRLWHLLSSLGGIPAKDTHWKNTRTSVDSGGPARRGPLSGRRQWRLSPTRTSSPLWQEIKSQMHSVAHVFNDVEITWQEVRYPLHLRAWGGRLCVVCTSRNNV